MCKQRFSVPRLIVAELRLFAVTTWVAGVIALSVGPAPSFGQAPVEIRPPANQTPTNQTPTNQTPTNQTPTNQTPANQTPTNRGSTNEVSGNQQSENPEPLNGRDGRDLLLRNFRPQSQLRVKRHLKTSAKFVAVDVHTHFHHRLHDSEEALDDYVELMNRNQIAVCASLDGKLGPQLEHHQTYLWSRYRERFVIFANIDWRGDGAEEEPSTWACNQPGFGVRTARQLVLAVRGGVSGLKVFKQFGLRYRNPDGSLITVDDRRFDPIWQACGELGIPVIIHTADPAAFFEPIDETNERWEELSRHPDWSFYGDGYPTQIELLEARNRVIGRHPETQFIGAHVANQSEDLQRVSEWLDKYPNLWIEPASRIAELGRQPFTARDFLIKYSDRILFGTDGPFPEKRVRTYWRFFETHDESFDYSEKIPPPQGFWQIHGIKLPDDSLRKLYHENAMRLIPGVRERVLQFQQRAEPSHRADDRKRP